MLRLLSAVLLTLGTTSSSFSSATIVCPSNTLAWTETRLFFGRDIGETGEVSAEQWRDFTVAEIIPRFGDGFTVIDGAGYWQGEACKAGNIALNGGCEKTKILLVQYGADAGADNKLNAIADAYIKRFNQEAVMRSDTPVCTQFITPKGTPDGTLE